MNLRTIAEAHRKLCEALQNNHAVAIDATAVSDADIAFVQLLESARLTAAGLGKSVVLTAPAGGALLETLKRGGFLHPQARDDLAFWLHQTGA